jgi:hypothetical protein
MKASRESKASKAYPVPQGLPGQRGQQVQQDRRVLGACKGRKATRVQRVPQGRKVPQVQPVLRDHRVQPAQRAPKEQPVHKA